MTIKRRTGLLAAAALAVPSVARADWPERPVRIIVPFAPGGSSDLIARVIGTALQDRLQQPVVVENRGGANGSIGMAAAAQAPADGYTLVVGHIGTHAITPAIMRSPGYDTLRDFETIAITATSSSVLVVPERSPARDLQGLLALARARPGALSYGSPGVGSPSHVTVVLLSRMTGISAQHVPYRGGGPAAQALAAGEVDIAFLDPTVAKPLADGGTVAMIATTGSRRFPSLPDLPTVAEAGVPHYVTVTSYALFVPKATPEPVIARLTAAANGVFDRPGFREDMAMRGISVLAGGPDALAAHVREENARWAEVIRVRNIRMN